uniref:Uncharacterized protein n=1 Tax=Parascaris equorum TaxID=6256 RepID=A0A914R6H9_PAREQ
MDDDTDEATPFSVLQESNLAQEFQYRLFQNGPLDSLSLLIEALLMQLNSRLVSVQNATAALLQLVLRNGYVYTAQALAHQAALASITASNYAQNAAASRRAKVTSITERLGRPGSQTGVALARLLGQKVPLAGSARFERGLCALAALVTPPPAGRASLFDRAVQLRGVLSATGALAEAINDPVSFYKIQNLTVGGSLLDF